MSGDSDINVEVLVAAKEEYTKQLMDLLCNPMYEGIKSIYNESKDECKKNNNPQVLKTFQLSLKQIPKWNQEMIDIEYERIQESTDCDWLDDLIQAVFIANVKIYSSIKFRNSNKKITLDIPSAKDFIHKSYIELARTCYENPHIMSHKVSEIDFHKNVAKCNKFIKKSIENAIRKLLPVQKILQLHLPDEDDLTKDTNMKNLRDLVKKEVESFKDSTQGQQGPNGPNGPQEGGMYEMPCLPQQMPQQGLQQEQMSQESDNEGSLIQDKEVILEVEEIHDNEEGSCPIEEVDAEVKRIRLPRGILSTKKNNMESTVNEVNNKEEPFYDSE